MICKLNSELVTQANCKQFFRVQPCEANMILSGLMGNSSPEMVKDAEVSSFTFPLLSQQIPGSKAS